MDRFWTEIACAASMKNLRCVFAYPPSSADQSQPKLEPTGGPFGALIIVQDFHSLGAINLAKFVRANSLLSVYLTDRPFIHWRYAIMHLLGVRQIVIHDHTPGDRETLTGIRRLLKSWLHRLPLFSADTYVSVSPWMRTRHLENACLPADRCVTVTNGIPLRTIVPDAREDRRIAWRIDSRSFVFCSLGRLTSYKRFDMSIRCLAVLADILPSLNPFLVLVGDGPERQSLAELAAHMKVADRVIFLGKVDDAWPTLCAVDAVLHPSKGEGLSLAIIESMSAERPVIVPDIPSVCQTIEHDQSGLVYCDESVDSAVAQLIRVATDVEFATFLGRNARQVIADSFDIESTLHSFRTAVVPRLVGTRQFRMPSS
jgi:glycosyltransferase involved in cell wall biosynthesis